MINAKARACGIAAVLGISLLASASPALATSATAAAGGTAPACVVREVTTVGVTHIADIFNNCSGTMHLKVVWNNAPDSGCTTVSPGGHFESRRGLVGSYSKTVTC